MRDFFLYVYTHPLVRQETGNPKKNKRKGTMRNFFRKKRKDGVTKAHICVLYK